MYKKKYVYLLITILIFSISTIRAQSAYLNTKSKTSIATPPVLQRNNSTQQILSRLLQLEDQRNLNLEEIENFLSSNSPRIRKRVALAIGRIGDLKGTTLLLNLLEDENEQVRASAVFSLGELEDITIIERFSEIIKKTKEPVLVRAYAAEALGKIISTPLNAKNIQPDVIANVQNLLIQNLPNSSIQIANESSEELFACLTITALFRIHSTNSIRSIAKLLKSPNEAIRFHAANALARLLTVDINPLEEKFVTSILIETLKDNNIFVRSLAAKALGPLQSSLAIDPLIELLKNTNSQVRINAVRSLGKSRSLKTITALVNLGEEELNKYLKLSNTEHSQSELLPFLLEIATAFGDLKAKEGINYLKQLRHSPDGLIGFNPEVEVALARIGSESFFDFSTIEIPKPNNWQSVANFAAGLGELSNDIFYAKRQQAITILNSLLAGKYLGQIDKKSIPEILRALAKYKSENLSEILLNQLKSEDLIVRATAAELLGEMSLSEEIFKGLKQAFAAAENDKTNDAKLAILVSLSHYNRPDTVAILVSALRDIDYLVRKQASDLLEILDPSSYKNKNYNLQVGIIKPNKDLDFYHQLVNKISEINPRAIIQTNKGSIEIELLYEDAPLTVENFLKLVDKKFFNGLTLHRVVPNFVVQGGDPRGDGNGGPGYQIRCEINFHRYERGSVGMALSGKDTGGSQFFICSSSQPHLDGGYTLFARVINGIEVIDRITRGDQIENIKIQK